MKVLDILVIILVLIAISGCGRTPDSEPSDLSSFPIEIPSLLSGFKRCVADEGSKADLVEVAEFVARVGIDTVPEDWEERFCDAQTDRSFEYHIATVGIEGTPLAITQTDVRTDGDALVPHNLVVGGHAMPGFSISPLEKTSTLTMFDKWSGSCVPFLFDVESEERWLRNVQAGTPEDNVYYIASLCRLSEFSFRYHRYEDGTWSEIAGSMFPKERALENLWDWQGGGLKYTRDTPKYIQDGLLVDNDLVFTRGRATVKPESRAFYMGLTARMWAHLESGVDFWQFDEEFSDESAKKHAEMYSEKYSIQ